MDADYKKTEIDGDGSRSTSHVESPPTNTAADRADTHPTHKSGERPAKRGTEKAPEPTPSPHAPHESAAPAPPPAPPLMKDTLAPADTPLSHPFSFSAASSPAVMISVVVGLLLVLLLLRRLRGGAVGVRVRRHSVLLLGLPSSGKTALFAQLTAPPATAAQEAKPEQQQQKKLQFCTSMEVNTGTYRGSSGGVAIVDYPGHPRLRSNVLPHLSEAKKLIVAIDTVTIHDDRHQGAVALADYLLSLLESPAFYGIRQVCFACTHRDEVTSYNIKAVKRLLEAAMARAIRARHGDVGRVDRVVDTKGNTIGVNKQAKQQKEKYSRGRHLELQCEDEEGNSFSFDSSVNMSLGGLDISFVDVSSVPDPLQHPFNVKAVAEFVEQ